MDEETEELWFWEVDEIYDLDGDLLIWSLMGVGIESLKEAIFISFIFIPTINKKINMIDTL